MASRTLSVVITGDASSVQRAMGTVAAGSDSLANKFSSVGKRMISTGARMTAGITLPLALLGKKSFDAASDLEESLSKVNVVFAENAGEIRKWSKSTATSMGISRQEALESAGTFGNLFRALEIGTPAATKMSTKLVGLAADLASFNNADPSEVLLAIRSGLVGEVEPMRKFGVSLSQVRIEAKAMELGLWDGEGAISAAAKTTAAYEIILQDTSLAQGDFARTADGAANRQRVLSAQFTNLAAQLGKVLLPIFQSIVNVVQDVAKWFGDLSPATQKVVVVAGLLLAVMGPLVTVFGAFAVVVGFLMSPIGLIIVGIAALAAVATALGVNWGAVWEWIKTAASNAWHGVIKPVVNAIGFAIGVMGVIVGGVFATIKAGWESVGSVFQWVWNNVIKPVVRAAEDAWGFVKSINPFGGGSLPGMGHGLGRANGGPASGLTLVGERGPELVNLPTGSHVWSHGQSMARGMGSGGNTYSIQVSVSPTADQAAIGNTIINAIQAAENVRGSRWRAA